MQLCFGAMSGAHIGQGRLSKQIIFAFLVCGSCPCSSSASYSSRSLTVANTCVRPWTRKHNAINHWYWLFNLSLIWWIHGQPSRRNSRSLSNLLSFSLWTDHRFFHSKSLIDRMRFVRHDHFHFQFQSDRIIFEISFQFHFLTTRFAHLQDF